MESQESFTNVSRYVKDSGSETSHSATSRPELTHSGPAQHETVMNFSWVSPVPSESDKDSNPLLPLESAYNTRLSVQYNTTHEYRNDFRKLFLMEAIESDLDIDSETLDEQNFDENASGRMLNLIYAATKDDLRFQELYDLSAALMFSTDREIGLAVLFSYDYFCFFHPCICNLIEKKEDIALSIQTLKNKIQ